jgi:hypothetical protein
LKKAFLLSALWLIPTVSTLAGPPFRTDDPIPVDYHHGEVYLFSTGTRDSDGTGGVGPAVEFNYGILPDTQFHLIAPLPLRPTMRREMKLHISAMVIQRSG